MSRKTVDVGKQIDVVRALGPDYAGVADMAEIGRAVCEAIRKHGGLPRQRKAAQPNGPDKPVRVRKTKPDTSAGEAA